MGKSTWTSFYIQLFFCHIHPDFIRSLQIHRALHTGDVTKRARNLVGDWMGSKGGREERGAKNVHKGVCSIKHEQWFIYVFFRRPSAAQKEELQWMDLLVCVCMRVLLWYRWTDEAWRYNGGRYWISKDMQHGYGYAYALFLCACSKGFGIFWYIVLESKWELFWAFEALIF